jgi:hypothetical protein
MPPTRTVDVDRPCHAHKVQREAMLIVALHTFKAYGRINQADGYGD